ncbi:MAG: lipoate--protein ligase family protein [Cyanobacteria bacterium SIG28]|nr:lipoate--protein ligase family protein [Cyanobacteria bacterium SIG28]
MTTLYIKGFKMKYIKFDTYTGEKNMQIDSDLLDEAIKTQAQEPIFRLYAWSPRCISLGRNQKDDFLAEVKEDCVRRLTGGRALLHDDEITYSYITPISAIPDGETISSSYKYISGILIDFFKTLGVDLDFGENKKVSTKFDYCMLISTGADVCYNGRKIIGSAQYRKQGYILQHGSILFGYNKELLETLFHEEISTESITTVNEVLPNMTKEEFVEKFEDYILNL